MPYECRTPGHQKASLAALERDVECPSRALVPAAPPSLLRRPSAQQGVDPTVLVVVLTTINALERRNAIRYSWHVPDDMAVRFAVCNQSSGEAKHDVQAEFRRFRDLVSLPCTEGYRDGLLTKKVVAAMQMYLDEYPHAEYFMKIDDDTFPRLNMFGDVLSHMGKYGYAGVIDNGGCPRRDPDNAWYEPETTFPEARFPSTAQGGPGYILSRALVHHFLVDDRQATESRMLRNEDKAVGVWVLTAALKGLPVNYVNVSGTNGFNSDCSQFSHMPFGNYPFILHHNVSASAMACMGDLEAGKSPGNTVGCCICQ